MFFSLQLLFKVFKKSASLSFKPLECFFKNVVPNGHGMTY